MPRKKSEKVVEEQEEFDVDEPSEVEELENNATDDDWTPADDEKKTAGRPQRASRNRKPIKVALTDGKTTSDEEEEEEEEEEDPEESRGAKRKRANVAVRGGGGRGRGRGRGGPAPASVKRARTDENGKGRGKKKTVEVDPEADDVDPEEDEEGGEEEEDSVSDEDDTEDDSEVEDVEIPPEFKSGKFVLLKTDFDNKEENYPLWKIDGKSLLQKFDKFMHNNEELYKGTTIYAGWSKAIIHTYYPIKVEVKTLENGESTVKFDPAQITEELKKAVFVPPPKEKKVGSDKEEEDEEEEEEEEEEEVKEEGEPEE